MMAVEDCLRKFRREYSEKALSFLNGKQHRTLK
jgi:hypothetical protein